MIRDSLVLLAFRQFASTIEIEKSLDGIAGLDDLKAWFLRLPWDEKAFKVQDDRTSTDRSDGSAGNWMARVCKDGPRLILTPTVNVFSAGTVVRGSRFWKRLTVALDQTYNGFHLDHPGGLFASSLAESAGTAFNRCNKAHFHLWTRAPAPPVRDDHATAKAIQDRQTYSMFYQ